jgi:hypothetical protein
MHSMDLTEIYNRVVAQEVTQANPNRIIIVKSSSGYAHGLYEVKVPLGHDVTEVELITRCDNRTVDLNEPMGQMCHFGGEVTKLDEDKAYRTYRVKVYQD